jgi:hypothetical protein
VATESVVGDVQGFFHVRVLIGLVTGISITRLLAGLSRFVQHPRRNSIYPAHFLWVIYLLVFVIHFWWFQFGLATIPQWEYTEYAFVLSYAALIFFISTLLFPDQMDDYAGFEDYFHSRARWFYGLLAVVFLVDIADSLVKGIDHFRSLGVFYPIRQCLLAGLAVIGMFVSRRSFHIGFALFAILIEIWWISARFLRLD